MGAKNKKKGPSAGDAGFKPADKDDTEAGRSSSQTEAVLPGPRKRRSGSGLGIRDPALFTSSSHSSRLSFPGTPLSGRLTGRTVSFGSPLGDIRETAAGVAALSTPRSPPRPPRSFLKRRLTGSSVMSPSPGTPGHMAMFGGFSGLEEMRGALKRQSKLIESMILTEKVLTNEADEAKSSRIEAELARERLERQVAKLEKQVEKLTRQLKEKDRAVGAGQASPPNEVQTVTQREKALQVANAELKEEMEELEARLALSFESTARAEKFLADSHRKIERLTTEKNEDQEHWGSIMSRNNEGGASWGSSTTRLSPKSSSPGKAGSPGSASQAAGTSSTGLGSTTDKRSDPEDDGRGETDDDGVQSESSDDSTGLISVSIDDWKAMMEEYTELQNMKEIFQFGVAAHDTLRAAADAGQENAIFEISDIKATLGRGDSLETQGQDESTQELVQRRSEVSKLKDEVKALEERAEISDREVSRLVSKTHDKRIGASVDRSLQRAELGKTQKDKLVLTEQSVGDDRTKALESCLPKPVIPGREAYNEHFQRLGKALQDKHQRQADLNTALDKETSRKETDRLRRLLVASNRELRAALIELPDMPGKEMLQEHDSHEMEVSLFQQQLKTAEVQAADHLKKQEDRFASKKEKELKFALFLAEDKCQKEKAELQGQLDAAKRVIKAAEAVHTKEMDDVGSQMSKNEEEDEDESGRREEEGVVLDEELTAQIVVLEKELAGLESGHKEHVRKVQEEQTDLKMEVINSKVDQQGLTEEIAQLHRHIAKLESAVEANQEKLRKAIDNKSTPDDAEKIKKLEFTISELKEEIEEKKRSLVAKEDETKSLQQNIKSQENYVQKLREQVEKVEAQITTKEKELQEAKARANKHRRSAQSLKPSHHKMALLKKTSLTSMEEVKQLTAQLQNLTNQVGNHIASQAKLEGLQELQRSIDRVEAEGSQLEEPVSLDEAKDLVSDQRASIRWYHEKLRSMKVARESLADKAEETEKELKQTKEELTRVKADLKEEKGKQGKQGKRSVPEKSLHERSTTGDELAQSKQKLEVAHSHDVVGTLAAEDKTTLRAWLREFCSAIGPILGGNGQAWVRVVGFLWVVLILVVYEAYGTISTMLLRVRSLAEGRPWTRPLRARKTVKWPEVWPGDVATVLAHAYFLWMVFMAVQTWWVLKAQLEVWLGANSITRAYYHDVVGRQDSPSWRSEVKMVDKRFWSTSIPGQESRFMAPFEWCAFVFRRWFNIVYSRLLGAEV